MVVRAEWQMEGGERPAEEVNNDRLLATAGFRLHSGSLQMSAYE